MSKSKRKPKGTYEERKAKAIEENQKVVQVLAKQQEDWWNSLSEEEQTAIAISRLQKSNPLLLKAISNLAQKQKDNDEKTNESI